MQSSFEAMDSVLRKDLGEILIYQTEPMVFTKQITLSKLFLFKGYLRIIVLNK